MHLNKKITRTIAANVLLAAIVFFAGCKHLQEPAIPTSQVNLQFPTIAHWQIYGAPAPMSHRIFILSKKIPENFPYTATSDTGFGGLLIVTDVLGAPAAYDLACPVEINRRITVEVDTTAFVARCPECNSTFDIFANHGYPTSGQAAKNRTPLKSYYIGPGPQNQYLVVAPK